MILTEKNSSNDGGLCIWKLLRFDEYFAAFEKQKIYAT